MIQLSTNFEEYMRSNSEFTNSGERSYSKCHIATQRLIAVVLVLEGCCHLTQIFDRLASATDTAL